MNNWIFDLFSGSDDIKKEAELTNKEKEWDRKVEANDWVRDVMAFDENTPDPRFEEAATLLKQMYGIDPNDVDLHAWLMHDTSMPIEDLVKQIGEKYELAPANNQACMASQDDAVTKTAAFEKGDTPAETIDKDYELRVKGLSDYNLAEMLAEYETMEKGITTLSFNEYKEDCMKSVKSGRDAAEKKLIKFLGEYTLLDWKKSFKEMEDSEVKFAAEKDLYTEWKEGKMAWEKKEKFEATTEKEKIEQMEGVGGEEEKGQVGKEASLKTAATPVEIIEKKVDKLIKDTIDKKFEEMAPAATVVDPSGVVNPVELPIVTEDSPEDKVLDALDAPHVEPGETPEHEEKEIEKAKEDKPEDKKEDGKEASLKTADELMDDVRENDPLQGKPSAYNPLKKNKDKEEKEAAPDMAPASDVLPVDVPENERGYRGWKNFESYLTAIWIDNDKEMQQRAFDLAKSSASVEDLGEMLRAMVEEKKPDEETGLFSELLNNSMRNIDWSEVANVFSDEMPAAEEAVAEPEVNTPDAAKPAVNPEKPPMGEIQPGASKKEVLKKIAEIDSPWKVVKNDKGEEIIARVAPVATTKKSKEKEKELGINSQDLV